MAVALPIPIGGKFFSDDRLDDFLNHRLANSRVVVADFFPVQDRMVLGGEDYFCDVHRLAVLIADGDLRLGVRPQPGELAARLAVAADEQVGEMNGHGHQGGGFGGGVSEHQPLVAGAGAVHALRNVGGLLAHGVEHRAVVIMKSVFGAVVSDVADDLAGDGFDVHPHINAHFAGDKNHAGFHQGFAGDADGFGILLGADGFAQRGVQHRVGDLVGNFVRMPGGD